MRGALLTALVAVALVGCEDRRKEAVDKVDTDAFRLQVDGLAAAAVDLVRR